MRKNINLDRDFESIGSSYINTRANINDAIVSQSLIETPKYLRLDSRINPRKSLILDICIKDRSGHKTVK